MDGMNEFEQKMLAITQRQILKRLEGFQWIEIPSPSYSGGPTYGTGIRLSVDYLKSLFAAVDLEAVKRAVIRKVEDGLADRIFNQMVTEMTTDVKHVLSNKALREDIRGVVRKRLEELGNE